MDQEDRSLWLILAGISVFSLWYVLSKRTENALWLVLAAVCFLILAYRLYGGLAYRSAAVSEAELPASGRHPTDAWIAFGYQFASISAVGIIVGPVLAAQFGYLPGYLWVLVAAVLAGGVHDLVVLVVSARSKGGFLPLAIAELLGPWAGLAAWAIVLMALVIFLAVTASFAADLLTGNVWALYVLVITVLVAAVVYGYEAWLRPGRLGEAVGVGIVVTVLALLVGSRLAMQSAGSGILANRGFVLVLLAGYCFVSAVLPLSVLGRTRVAISGYVGIGAVVLLALGIAFAAPFLRQPPTSQYVVGGGPLMAGGLVPSLFLIVSAGAISGFNGLVGSSITGRLLKTSGDALPVGFGALLLQGFFVAALLVSVCTLWRWDFYAFTTAAHLGEMDRMAGGGNRDWDNMRGLLQTDSFTVPGGQVANPQIHNTRNTSGITAVAAGASWMFRDVPGVKRAWLPTLYRLWFVIQALLLVAAVEAAARVGRVAVESASEAALRLPSLSALAAKPTGKQALVVGGTLLFTLVWLILAGWSNVSGAYRFMTFVGFLLAAVALGVGVAVLYRKAGWAVLPVVVALAMAAVLTLLAGGALIKDNVRSISRKEALTQVYNDMPTWVLRVKPLELDRARDMVRQWPAAEMTRLYSEKRQDEVLRQIQGRLGLSEQDARAVLATMERRASGLSLWAWVQIILVLVLVVLAIGVGLGAFVRVPLAWPTRGAPTRVAAPAVQPKPEPSKPSEEADFEI